MSVSTQHPHPPVLGVIDSVTAGFDLVNRHPWLVAVPVLLDLLLWWGPRLGIAPLMTDFLRATATAGLDMSPDYAQTMEAARQSLSDMAQEVNLLGLLAAGFVGVPSLIGVSVLGRDLLEGAAPAFQVTSWLVLFPLILLLLLASVWIAALYLVPLAQTVRGGALSRGAMARALWVAGWRLTVWLGLLLAILVLAGAPVMFVLGLVMLVSANLASFGMGLLWIAVLWVGLYLFFVVQSITVGGVGVFRSIWNSLNVVRWNLSSALGLVILVNLIQRGLPLAWQSLATEAWGMPIGILGNAYVGTGLMAASMIFYRERYALWQSWVKMAQARQAAAQAQSQSGSPEGSNQG